ncbi:hypothetical protein HN935_03575 [archaeon]|jgi:hypothetical protein|nr:hypothetical protein [archaeon]
MTNTIGETRFHPKPPVAPVTQAEGVWAEMRRDPRQEAYHSPINTADSIVISEEAREAAYAKVNVLV